MFCIIWRYLVWGYNRQIAEDMHMVDKANLCSLELGRFTCSSDGRYHQTGWCIYWYSFLSELLASAFSDLEASLTITLDWTQPGQTTYQLFSWPCIHRLSGCSSIYSFILPFWSFSTGRYASDPAGLSPVVRVRYSPALTALVSNTDSTLMVGHGLSR